MPRTKPTTLKPKLRFPAFRDQPGWDVKPLGKVSQFVKQKIPHDDLKLDTYVSTENLLPDYAGVEQATKLPPNGTATAYEPDDVLIANIRPYLKKVWRSDRTGGASNDVIVIRPESEVRKDYLHLALANDSFINYVMKTAKGVKMPRGDIAAMKEYEVFLPDPAEQRAIADCLGSVDAWLAAAGRKLAALRDHKRGLMQQLFPQPGQSQPQQRFPEFQKAGKWKQTKLIKLTDELRDGDWIESKDQSDDGIRIIQTGNVGEGVFIPKSGNARYISADTFKRLNCREVFPGDCLVSRLPDPIGRCCLLPEIGTRMVTAVDCAIIRFNLDRMLPYFFVCYSQTSSYLEEADALGSGSTRKRISRENLSRIVVPTPEKAEQQKIAACLTALDTQITAQAAQIESLKTHKHGLMQQLFPSPPEGAI